MRDPKPYLTSLLVGLAVAQLALPVRAEDKGERGSDAPPSRAEFNKLQTDVREQRQLIIQMLQTEQQRYDMLLHLMQGQGGGTPLVGVPGSPEPAEAPAADTTDKATKKSPAVAAVDHRVSRQFAGRGHQLGLIDKTKAKVVSPLADRLANANYVLR